MYFMHVLVSFLLLSWTAGAIAAQTTKSGFGLNDVSVLIPLPESEGALNRMLKVSDSGSKGVLFPLEYFRQFRPSTIIPPEQQDGFLYPMFRIVSARFDPCGVNQTGHGPCEKQIRLVAQPVSYFGSAFVTDFAFHLFYTLTDAEFSSLVANLRVFKESMKVPVNSPLGVHPGLQAAGLESVAFDNFNRMLLSYIGRGNLTKFTFAQIRHIDGFEDFGWTFGSVHVGIDQKLQLQLIPRVQTREQSLIVQVDDAFFGPQIPITDFSKLHSLVIGNPNMPIDNIVPLLGRPEAIKKLAPRTFRAAVSSSHRMENPRYHDANSMDCVSCHIASSTRAVAQSHYGEENALNPFQYTSAAGFPLTVEQRFPKDQRLIRAFGYTSMVLEPGTSITAFPSILPRTAHESDVVAAYLNH